MSERAYCAIKPCGCVTTCEHPTGQDEEKLALVREVRRLLEVEAACKSATRCEFRGKR